MTSPPFVDRIYRRDDIQVDDTRFPFSLPFVASLELVLRAPVTFFVGENGSGKSTLLEALAALSNLPVGGGGRNELDHHHAPHQDSGLSHVLRAAFRRRPSNGYFFRAEFQAHFASLLDARRDDPEFRGDPYCRYGGRSLHARSHGEAFLSVIQDFEQGLFLMDEPEAALSPQRQLTLLSHIHRLVADGRSQFVMATHSPILMTFPDAQLVSFDDPALPNVELGETSHFQITSGILRNPARYWQHLASHADREDE